MLYFYLTLLFSLYSGINAFNFSNTLGSHMVLQHPAIIWGYGEPGDSVVTTVTQLSTPLKSQVGANGIWKQALPTNIETPVGSTGVTVSSVNGEGSTITLNDVLFGKVILCSGQSNIELVTVPRALNATAELEAAPAFPFVRIFRTADVNEELPQIDLPIPQQPWALPSNATLQEFSATCWFTARDQFLVLEGQVPVGIVQSAVGGTAVRNWSKTFFF